MYYLIRNGKEKKHAVAKCIELNEIYKNEFKSGNILFFVLNSKIECYKLKRQFNFFRIH